MHSRLILLLILIASTAWAKTENNVNEQFDCPPGGQLIVDVDFGTIDVGVGTDGKVTVDAIRKIDSNDEAREKEYFAERPLLVAKEGDTITVKVRRNRDRQSYSWNGSVSMDARYTIRVPKNFNADLRTCGGSVAATGVTGDVKADTSGGK